MTITTAAPVQNNTVRNVSIAAAVIGLLSCCVLSPVAGFAGYNYAQSQAPTVASATKEPKTETPAIVADENACYGVVDGSIVPYGDKVEFNPAISNSVTGPAVVEWWDGAGGEGHEGMWFVHEGQTQVFEVGVRGGYWQIISSSAMSAEDGLKHQIASHLHLVMYAQKPQHTYAVEELQVALDSCDWSSLTKLLVVLPPTE